MLLLAIAVVVRTANSVTNESTPTPEKVEESSHRAKEAAAQRSDSRGIDIVQLYASRADQSTNEVTPMPAPSQIHRSIDISNVKLSKNKDNEQFSKRQRLSQGSLKFLVPLLSTRIGERLYLK